MAQASSQPGPLHDLTGFQRDLLVTAAGLTEPSGLEIKAELEEHYEESIHHGRLYPNLNTLVEKGLVEKGSKDRRTNKYPISARGERELGAQVMWEETALNGDDAA